MRKNNCKKICLHLQQKINHEENFGVLASLHGSAKNKDAAPTAGKLVPILWGTFAANTKEAPSRPLKILLDTGASASIIHAKFAQNCAVMLTNATVWNTAAGEMSTNQKVKGLLHLPEFYDNKVIEHTFHVTNLQSRYDMLIGRDLLSQLALKIDFAKNVVQWEDREVPLKTMDCKYEDSFFIQYSPAVESSLDRIKKILDAKYEPANLQEVVNRHKHLTSSY